MNVAVLASGRGSNLRRLVEAECARELGAAHIVAVATNRAGCGAAEYAHEAGIPLAVFSQRDYDSAEARDAALREWLLELEVELVVLAGYDRVLSRGFTDAFPDRVINVHPSLLPAFAGGMDAVDRALEHGVKVTGCTVHLLGDEVDGGPILAQAAVEVQSGDTIESLLERIHAEEHRILPEVVKLLSSGHVRREGRRVIIEAEPVTVAAR